MQTGDADQDAAEVASPYPIETPTERPTPEGYPEIRPTREPTPDPYAVPADEDGQGQEQGQEQTEDDEQSSGPNDGIVFVNETGNIHLLRGWGAAVDRAGGRSAVCPLPSPSLGQIAFIDQDGLQVVDLDSAETRSVASDVCCIFEWLNEETLLVGSAQTGPNFGQPTLVNVNSGETESVGESVSFGQPDALASAALIAFDEAGRPVTLVTRCASIV